MNKYPTGNEEAAMRDVLLCDEPLAARAERLGVTKAGAYHLLLRCEKKGLAKRLTNGSWQLTAAGLMWIRPSSARSARGAR